VKKKLDKLKSRKWEIEQYIDLIDFNLEEELREYLKKFVSLRNDKDFLEKLLSAIKTETQYKLYKLNKELDLLNSEIRIIES